MPYRLVGEMKRMKIRQRTLANLLGLTSNAVSYKLRGEREFTADEMYKIRDEYFPNMTIDELFQK